MWPTFSLRRPFALILLALVSLAWVVLALWGQSPYGRYLSIWTMFGMLVYLGDSALHAAVARSAWLADHAWAFSALVLLLAGVYQFTPLKYHCLEKCRSPLSFITEHWRGHGECVGNFGWMLVLGALMAIEK